MIVCFILINSIRKVRNGNNIILKYNLNFIE